MFAPSLLSGRSADDVNGEPARTHVRIAVVLFALTVIAGAVDAITFLGLGHAFAALTTGNVLFLGFGVVRAGTPVARPAEALAAFVAGTVAAHLVVTRLDRGGRRWFVPALCLEAATVLLAGLTVVGVSGRRTPPEFATAIAVALLAAAMGWRSRVMMQAGIPDMPTTVLQITLVKFLSGLLPGRSAAAREPVLPQARRLGTVLGVFVGGVTGALLLRLGPGPALLCVAALSGGVAAGYAGARRLRPPPDSARVR
ncbi:YoaK family protein [Streptomyces sp. NPDC096012]|uniref:YoaK family protein n=1 Tax=Streptomyces sp. NPDC096012 TaxID=3155684 RepID=UPI00336AA3FA